jgi:hypothetical protein
LLAGGAVGVGDDTDDVLMELMGGGVAGILKLILDDEYPTPEFARLEVGSVGWVGAVCGVMDGRGVGVSVGARVGERVGVM